MAEKKFKCKEINCTSSFSRRWNLIRHEQRHHNNTFSESCLLCKKIFTESAKLQKHLILDHGPSDKFYLKETAFDEAVVKYRLTFDDNENNFNNAQSKIINEIRETIRFQAAKKTVVKVSLIFICQMSMQDLTGEKIHSTLIPFRSSTFVTNGLRNTGLTNKIKTSFRQQENFMEEFCDSGSNWIFDRAVAYDIEMSGIKPLVVGSGKANLTNFKNEGRLNGKIKHHKFLYDPKNIDDRCFIRCLHFLLKKKCSFEKWSSKLELKGISFPISIGDVKKFVRLNTKLNIKLNILYRNLNKQIFPFECGIGSGEKVLNLLMVEKNPKVGTEIKVVRHFLGITNLDKYLSQKYINPYTSKCSYTASHYCVSCFNGFKSQTALLEHSRICHSRKPIIEDTPDKGVHLKFTNHKNQHMQDFIAFLDFECLLKPGDEKNKCQDCRSIRCKCDKSFTEILNHQEPFAYSFVILNSQNKIIHERTYLGQNAASDFIDHLLSCWEEWIKDLLETKKEMKFTSDDEIEFNNSSKCYLCKSKFDSSMLKNRDHNHYTGEYLGAACTICNLQRRRPNKIPIFLHNGSKYDFHFIIRALNKKKVGQISILPYNGEHFRTIEFKGFKFLDSLAFLQASLDQLSEDLSKTDHNYKILKQTYLTKTNQKFDQEKFDLLLKKNYYPYEYCTSMEIMKDTRKIPKIGDFYSSLREKTITKEEHKIAQKVWRVFGCENLLDYTKLYCKLDTILLAEIFQKFRKDMHDFSFLDPAHYISLPAFAFDSMMKLTKCELELLSDINMIHFIEASIRGGVSFINNRYLESKEEDKSEIVYIDANNLYGLAQMSKLPYTNFEWMTTEEIERLNWKEIETEGDMGFILEVDLEYPKKYHREHSNFPLAPENIEITYNDLSSTMKEIFHSLEQKSNYKDRKLVGTFRTRIQYVLHFKNLKLYLQLGMKLRKIHRVMKFHQRAFIAPFIRKCTHLRQISKTKFEQDQFKKVANCVYGKTIQNTRNYIRVRLHNNMKSLLNWVSDATFKSFSIIGENLVQTNHTLDILKQDRPIYVGFTILELSKHFMFNFYYNILMKGLKCELDLGMSDTDSFLFKISDSNKFRDHIKEHMDYSNYPIDHPLYSSQNKAKLGYFKDELAGKQICREFIGLKSKCYSLLLKDISSNELTEKKVCKGLGRQAIQNRLKFEHYKKCLFQGIPKRFDFNIIRSKKHHITTARINKKAISHFDSKRWIHPCGIHSDPYGSSQIDPKRPFHCPKC